MNECAVNAILISSQDDVATVTAELREGDIAVFERKSDIIQIRVIEIIPKFHKVAIRNISKSETVRKYGEIIGRATQNISQGSHVHDHNIISPI